MTELPINANISEIDGPYYAVKLQWVPRAGELIDLWTFTEQAEHGSPVHHYEVVQVVHRITTALDKGGREHKGQHVVTIHVKRVDPTVFGT